MLLLVIPTSDPDVDVMTHYRNPRPPHHHYQ
jgi:hypothetical protein